MPMNAKVGTETEARTRPAAAKRTRTGQIAREMS